MLNDQEKTLIQELCHGGIENALATLAVVMLIHEYARPEEEIIDIVRRYPGLEIRAVAAKNIAELRGMGWLVTASSYGQLLLQPAPDIAQKIAGYLKNPSLADEILQLRMQYDEKSTLVLGPMNSLVVYQSFLAALRSAQREICLPMLATSPHQDSVAILKERAQHGVHVRILLASHDLVSKLRGEANKQASRDAIHGWIHNAKGIDTMEVKIVHSLNDALIASCLCVDGRLLRFAVYAPDQQRSLDGMMVQIQSSQGLHLNIVKLFQLYFDDVWSHAEPTHFFGRLWWRLPKGWQWWAFGCFAVLGLISYDRLNAPYWAGILGSVAATFLLNAVVASATAIRAFFKRLFRP